MRSNFNTARLIVDNLAEGIEYSNIVKVFHISLLYFSVGHAPLYHGKTVIEEIESKQKLTFHIEDPKTKKVFDTTQIFPEYFFISVPEFNDRIEREIDEWLYLMKHDTLPPKAKGMAKGIAKERAEGDARRAKEKIDIVKELLLEEFSLEKISRITKLDLQTIEMLAKEALVCKNFHQFATLTLEKETEEEMDRSR
jgi:hypothetical protein